MNYKHICKNCNKEYYSYKEKSNFCSNKCKKEYSHVPYKCDYCGKEFLAKRSSYEKLLKGEQKHLYCSVECANNGFKNSITKICKNCGKEFTVWKSYESQEYCSKDCMYEYKRNHSVNKIKICPICNKEFKQKHPEQKYCSVECRNESMRSRITCICEYCGKEFDRKKSEVNKNKHHYCLNECRMNGMFWNKNDIQILIDNYGKIKYKEMCNLFYPPKTIDEIRRKAIYLGLTSPRDWSEEELNILINNYSNVPINEMLKLLPNRTKSSILGKAKGLNLKSYFYLTSKYSDNDIKYLKENYLNKSNKELAECLNRSEYGIEQYLRILGLQRPKEIGKYKDLIRYVRARITPWKNKIRKDCNYTCALSGCRSNIVVHHIRSFNLIFEETIENLNFKEKEFSEYTIEELNNFVEEFMELQDYYNSYICITETIHKDFHNKYGYGYNTEEQWDEYIEKYYNKTI